MEHFLSPGVSSIPLSILSMWFGSLIAPTTRLPIFTELQSQMVGTRPNHDPLRGLRIQRTIPQKLVRGQEGLVTILLGVLGRPYHVSCMHDLTIPEPILRLCWQIAWG